MERVNCGFEKVEILSDNVGYLKFNMFADPAVCGPTATAAMNFLQHVGALIVDMRDNGGGAPAMVAYVTSDLFNWEGTGVEPDVEVSAADALEKAQELARQATEDTPNQTKLAYGHHTDSAKGRHRFHNRQRPALSHHRYQGQPSLRSCSIWATRHRRVALKRANVQLPGKNTLSTGDILWSSRSKHMLTIVKDDVGRHDFLYAACSQEMYTIEHGLPPGHPNCTDNLTRALRTVGADVGDLPTPFNVFQNSPPDPTGALAVATPLSKPGDAIEFKAEMDLFVAVSACLSVSCTAGNPSPIEFKLPL